ncbi:CHASE2 domain-containing protein [Aerosakkonema funiforme]|uniref:Adenylate/guanylate cyclase domain-containing protein n=2 Tax=Oscillatoriophycideae TaxID=1301283 RepID=A0A926VFA1_9CYAN|nr:adenylate/guanylate cyclase domain-containing protein [Aerosakkonema funiforme]MBD2181469.1 adenylate/guanylate cyclase domain-containing protein [Aerosakkonema funiforme FACHB-1375]
MWKRLNTFVKDWGGVLIIAPNVAALLIALRLAGFLQSLEWAALDRFFLLRPLSSPDSRILIVGISESDIRKVGKWPIPDGDIAQLIEKIKQQKPSAIGLDVYRDLPVEPGHQKLVQVFQTTPNLIGVKKVSGARNGFAVNPSSILANKGQVGASDLVIDADGKVRRGFLYIGNNNGEVVPSLPLKLAFIYLQSKGIIPKNAAVNPEYLQLGKAVFIRFQPNDGGYVRTSASGYQVLMNFRGPRETFQIVTMMDVLENRIPANLMRDRIVLIGSNAASLQDYFQTPYDDTIISSFPKRTSGVEIHANSISQMIAAALDGRPLIQVWSEPLEWLWIFGWSVIGVSLALWGRYFSTKYRVYSAYWIIFTIAIAGGILIIGSYLAFSIGWWIPVVPSLLALSVSQMAMAIHIANLEREERQALMKLFERNVTPKIAEAIWRDRSKFLEEGELQAQEMMATVLFTDLKGFSSIAENMEPKILMSWLNDYMKVMTQVVLDRDGVIDKFIGDAIMAVFGVPIPSTTPEKIALDAQKAVSCAVAMAEVLKSLNRRWQSQGLPTVCMRVGIATGVVVAGSLGSDRRQDYTVIGDTVNIASRLESYDKTLDGGSCRILISEDTYVYNQDKFLTKLVGSVLLKGREHPVKVYQVLVE